MSSLADRISKPDANMNASNGSSWADETTNAADTSPAAPTLAANAEKEMSDLGNTQTDGASDAMNGNAGIIEPSYDVDVKLSDLQADPNDPLYSAKSFEELGL